MPLCVWILKQSIQNMYSYIAGTVRILHLRPPLISDYLLYMEIPLPTELWYLVYTKQPTYPDIIWDHVTIYETPDGFNMGVYCFGSGARIALQRSCLEQTSICMLPDLARHQLYRTKRTTFESHLHDWVKTCNIVVPIWSPYDRWLTIIQVKHQTQVLLDSFQLNELKRNLLKRTHK
jgi:hypothetical protein